ncbi:helix-turn-helix domain-containing protein [Streptomyces sp. NPDC056544]|uniref:helix-turn-helix domain-containing protein n=1 Tax=unclassified Streptomyces TaxID=2593676 RepID=UPI00369746DD
MAQWLRSLRQTPGLTVSQVAIRTELVEKPTSRSTLYRAELIPASGRGPSVPAWHVVEAYTKACDGNLVEARHLWMKAAAVQTAKKANGIPLRPAMAPPYIFDPADLLIAMRQLRLQAGRPTLRELEKRATYAPDAVTLLPRSTLGAVLNGTRKCRRDLLFHFIRACGVRKDSEVLGWLEAWDRVEAYRNGDRRHPHAATAGRPRGRGSQHQSRPRSSRAAWSSPGD